MSSIKDALMKAGFRPTKKENERERRPKFEQVQKSVIHQEQRNYCESCHMVQPDVEHYKHRNPTVEAAWICVACADKHMISDDFRVSNQSDFAKRSLFRREFGRTKRPQEFVQAGHNPSKRDQEGNKGGGRDTRRYAEDVEDKYEREDRKSASGKRGDRFGGSGDRNAQPGARDRRPENRNDSRNDTRNQPKPNNPKPNNDPTKK
jgi:hypothetical protein